MKYVYPAVFTPLPSGEYDVRIPDLPGCVTCGDNLIDAIEMGRDALSMWLFDAENKQENIPATSQITNVEYDDKNSFISLIDADTITFRKENYNKAVKKTLSIPGWLNVLAEKADVNFSQILQDALKKYLNIDD